MDARRAHRQTAGIPVFGLGVHVKDSTAPGGSPQSERMALYRIVAASVIDFLTGLAEQQIKTALRRIYVLMPPAEVVHPHELQNAFNTLPGNTGFTWIAEGILEYIDANLFGDATAL